MKRSLIRYKTKPERTEENERLIKSVFVELHAKSPAGVRYLALKLGDGSFVHIVAADPGESATAITSLDAFSAFQNGIKDRTVEPPQSNDATIVGNYTARNPG
jgi:hypothetical protein